MENLESEVDHSFELANILLDQKNTLVANELNRYKKFRINKETMQLYGAPMELKMKNKAFKAEEKVVKKMEAEKQFAESALKENERISTELVE